MNFTNQTIRLSVAIAVGAAGSIAAAPATADVPRDQLLTVSLAVPINDHGTDYVHNYTLTMNPCDGTLAGAGLPGVNGQGESTFGSLSGDTLSYTSTYYGPLPAGWGRSYFYTAIIDITTGTGTWYDNGGAPGGVESGTIIGAADTVQDLTRYRNHGAFVAAHPDKNTAEFSCISRVPGRAVEGE